MALYEDYLACISYLETVEEEMDIPERSAARPRLDVLGKDTALNNNYHNVDDEVLSQDFSFGENESSDDQDCGSPKESIFSMGSASDVPKLRLQNEEDELDQFMAELEEAEIFEISDVITYTRKTPRLHIRR